MSELAFEIAQEQAERIAELEAELATAMKVSINDQKMLEDAWGKNAKLREYKDKDLESHKLRVVMKENAKLREALELAISHMSPSKRWCVQKALNPSQTITDTEEQFQKSVGVRDDG
jgi:precorrin-2 methylase